jgi:succinyl-diaminopimelate desuccinylase
MLEHLKTLVSMPTITADIAANDMALEYVGQYLHARGMQVQYHRFEGRSALTASTRKSNHKKQAVCLSAHIDVVTGDESVFSLREEDGKLLGRGVFDMKFAIAGYMQLVDELAEAGTLKDYDFSIMLTADEEETPGYGRSGVANLIREGFRPQVCVLPDSTAPGWNIEKIAKGWWRFDLIATGKSVHSARPWEGESASLKLIHALHELKGRYAEQTAETDTLNIGSIHGEGEGIYNQVPGYMSAKIEIRLTEENSWPKSRDLIEDLCERHGLQHETFSLVMPVRALLDNDMVRAYMAAVKEVTGKRPKGMISLGGSDAPYFTAAGIPCILSCPEGGNHHSDQEWINKASFEQFMPILYGFLERTAHTKPTKGASVDKKRRTKVK